MIISRGAPSSAGGAATISGVAVGRTAVALGVTTAVAVGGAGVAARVTTAVATGTRVGVGSITAGTEVIMGDGVDVGDGVDAGDGVDGGMGSGIWVAEGTTDGTRVAVNVGTAVETGGIIVGVGDGVCGTVGITSGTAPTEKLLIKRPMRIL